MMNPGATLAVLLVFFLIYFLSLINEPGQTPSVKSTGETPLGEPDLNVTIQGSCAGMGWRPPANPFFPIDHGPSDGNFSVAFPFCTNYIKWSMPNNFSNEFENSMLCPIIPFDQLSKHKFAVNCSSWDRRKGLAVSTSSYHADVTRFASMMWQCNEQQRLFFQRFLVTNLCSSSNSISRKIRHQKYHQNFSLVYGCQNLGPATNFRWGNAVLTHVKFIEPDPEHYSCVPSSDTHTRLTVIAWTGINGNAYIRYRDKVMSTSSHHHTVVPATVTAPSIPASQCIWKQQAWSHLIDPSDGGSLASLEVAWKHGSPDLAFRDPSVCNPLLIRPLLVIAGDMHDMDNTWHMWHNVIFLTFSALYDSGLLTCNEITGNCSVSTNFDFLHLFRHQDDVNAHPANPDKCAVIRRLFGMGADSRCSESQSILPHTCYEKVIMQASSRSNAHIYSSENGTIVRLFARAVEDMFGLKPLTPTEVEKRPAHVVFLSRSRRSGRRSGFSAESISNLERIMKISKIPFTKLSCTHTHKNKDIAIIRSATVLIGATGAAFTNAMHLTKGAVVVLATTGRPWFECWYFRNLVLNTGSTFIRWTPSKQNYSDPNFNLVAMYPTQNKATWETVLHTALMQQDQYAQAHPRVAYFLEKNKITVPQDRRCHALLMVYKPKK